MQGKKANPSQHSTGVMDKPVLIEIAHSTILVSDDMTWTPLEELQDEAVQLVQGVTSVVNEPATPEVTSSPSHPNNSVGASPSATFTNRLVENCVMFVDILDNLVFTDNTCQFLFRGLSHM